MMTIATKAGDEGVGRRRPTPCAGATVEPLKHEMSPIANAKQSA